MSRYRAWKSAARLADPPAPVLPGFTRLLAVICGRRKALAHALGLVLILASACHEPANDVPPAITRDDQGSLRCPDCNVILVTVDTLRPDRMSNYGYERDTTPNIRRAFAQATRFDNVVSPAPCTVPAVLQLMTSDLELRDSMPRLAERLDSAGYQTGAVATQHHFFDREGVPHVAYERGFDSFAIRTRDHLPATDVTNEALRWLDANKGARKRFLWLHYFDPHVPYDPPPAHSHFVTGDVPEHLRHSKVFMQGKLGGGVGWQSADVFSAKDVEQLRGLYDGDIHFMDAQLQRVIERLDKYGMLDTSIVIFTSDHGERLGEDKRWFHCQTMAAYEMRVPLMIMVAGQPLLPPNSPIREHAVSTLDIVPTVLSVLGLAYDPQQLDGINIYDIDSERIIRTAFRRQRMGMTRRWKMHRPEGGAAQLYRVDLDPYEKTDVAAEFPEIVSDLSAGLYTERLRLADDRVEVEIEKLRAIGYTE
jgi:arylsulfatase A-like enzyme